MINNENLSNLMKNTMENLKSMIDVDTVIGKPIESSNGTLIIPVSKLSFGFISGGSEYAFKNSTEMHSNFPFGGGSSAGVSVKPMAFLIVKQDCIRLLPIDNNTSSYDKIIDTIPQVLDVLKNLCKNNNSHTTSATSSSYEDNIQKEQ